MNKSNSAILLLADGRIFEGRSFGYQGETVGEVCFNTGMTGYQEILTDPSYCKQIVTMTSPHIGNYGINAEDIESENIQVAGFVIKEETMTPSNWRSTQSLGEYLKKNKIVGIKEIDTRSLTRHIRDKGAMNGIISSNDLDIQNLDKKLKKFPDMNGLDLAKDVTTQKKYKWPGKGRYKVAVIDFGIKKNILRILKIYKLARKLLFLLPPEQSQNISHFFLKLFSGLYKSKQTHFFVKGLRVKNRLGLAAGLDKNARLINEFDNIGFGFVEVGTVTPKAQYGNPKPRIKRLISHESLLNSLGFPNEGVRSIKSRLKKVSGDICLGVNIGPNKDIPAGDIGVGGREIGYLFTKKFLNTLILSQ